MVLIYVDDMIVTGNNPSSLQQFVLRLNNQFALKDMGSLHHFLGVEVQRDVTGMYLTQTRYIEDLLKRAGLENTKPCPTPAAIGKHYTSTDGDPMTNPTIYGSIVGGLQYLTNTRPDISYIVNKLSQYLQHPTTTHWQVVKRVLRYLKGTRDMGVHIKPCDRLALVGFFDADWACNLEDRKSVAGYCIFLGDTIVSWSSKKQNVVAQSSTESEYRALANAACELAWIQSLLHEFSFPLPAIPITWCDNLSAGALAANPAYHARTKHIGIYVHFIRDRVPTRLLQVEPLTIQDIHFYPQLLHVNLFVVKDRDQVSLMVDQQYVVESR
ncbi:uncharacterized mitochondrial protein AtMg00810-like [Tripterygium wilfordii]|uniref:uncharacterized mitochondrial protein AtMg00810-like n=1 Tax=Tripterygium wilfordii TaxID=458696 RepID=UPI0018F830A7|nr:uncharacterized mitochondrial protein AtMg00810-like [Tripterygium wilfordii]